MSKDLRKDNNTRRHFGMIEICFNCSGEKEMTYDCDIGQYDDKYKKCVWKNVVDNDLEKIANNDNFLTFPILKEIVKKYETNK